jgi:nitrogen regulatory protein P-II 1
MKKIEAIIQPNKLEAVKEALSEITVNRLTVSDVQGFGRQKGHTEIFRGHEYEVNFLRKIKLEIILTDELLEPTIEAIISVARSEDGGKIGDGKIFVFNVEECIRIRTGEKGPSAV